jgi:hypothetical protein
MHQNCSHRRRLRFKFAKANSGPRTHNPVVGSRADAERNIVRHKQDHLAAVPRSITWLIGYDGQAAVIAAPFFDPR